MPSATLVRAFGRWSDRLAAGGSRLTLAGVDPDLHTILTRSGLVDKLGADNVVAASSIVFEAVETAYEEGTRWLAARPTADAGEV